MGNQATEGNRSSRKRHSITNKCLVIFMVLFFLTACQSTHPCDSTQSTRIPQPILPMSLPERAGSLFAECYLRVMTYAEMGGEKDEELDEEAFSLLWAMGDLAFAETLRSEPIDVQSAMRLVLGPSDTKGFPRTADILRNAPRKRWPTEVRAQQLYKHVGQARVDFDRWRR